jgi:hypothetical protein
MGVCSALVPGSGSDGVFEADLRNDLVISSPAWTVRQGFEHRTHAEEADIQTFKIGRTIGP